MPLGASRKSPMDKSDQEVEAALNPRFHLRDWDNPSWNTYLCGLPGDYPGLLDFTLAVCTTCPAISRSKFDKSPVR